MSVRKLFTDYILSDTPVEVELSGTSELKQLISSLNVMKSRYLKQLQELGMKEELDTFEGRTIQAQLLEDGTSKYRIYLAAPRRSGGVQFKILSGDSDAA
jgi:hypothetical protein